MSKNPLNKTTGRGSEANSTSRFDKNKTVVDLENYGWWDEEDQSTVKTEFFKDSSKTIITQNDSPDIPFRYSLNAYRGCEHGCAYCYARPTHEYLGMSAGVDFESKIFVKEQAPQLLREKLMSRSWEPDCVVMSGVTDCYQPAERKYQLTRQCLQIFAEFKNPVSIITKNHLVTRDIDILREMAKDDLVMVFIPRWSLDQGLTRVLEPRTSAPAARLKAISMLAEAGIPVGVNAAPMIPGLNDHELPAILKASKEAGAQSAGYTILRLPYSVSELFVQWLEKNRPDSKDKVIKYIREIRGGKLNNSDFSSRMRGEGPKADQVRKMFKLFKVRYGLDQRNFELRTDLFQRPGDQLGFSL